MPVCLLHPGRPVCAVVAQVSEAEAMVSGGVRDVFISNEVVAPNKLRRLVALAAQGEHPGQRNTLFRPIVHPVVVDCCCE